jgi:polyhydroxybutyrate depolymerase
MPAMQHRTINSIMVPLLAWVVLSAWGTRQTQAAEPTTAPATQPVPLGAGNHMRTLAVDGRQRTFLVHVPRGYDPEKPTPVVLAFHGAFMNGASMALFSGLSAKADDAGFIVVYPDGVGIGTTFLFFNAFLKPGGAALGNNPPDDVAFTAKLLDDLATVCNVDSKRVFATGMSNGGMMCHRLGAELSGRIAAIAPVSGTLAIEDFHPTRPVPAIMFHGTADTIVPFGGTKAGDHAVLKFKGVDDTVKAWVQADGCQPDPTTTTLPDTAHDGTTVKRHEYGSGKDGAEVVLYEIEGGGHTWPGQQPPVAFLGKSTSNISANDLIWEFFQKHPMK